MYRLEAASLSSGVNYGHKHNACDSDDNASQNSAYAHIISVEESSVKSSPTVWGVVGVGYSYAGGISPGERIILGKGG